MYLIPSLDVQDELFLAEVKSARRQGGAESQGTELALRARPGAHRALCAQSLPRGRGCREPAPPGLGLRHTVAAK